MSGFDPYLGWLDIPPHERPPTYYRLLGLRPLESDPQIIASSAQRVIAHVSQFQHTEHAAACTQLLGELTAARDCLLNPGRKQAYDSGMSQPLPPASGGGPLPTQPHSPQEQPLAGPIPSSPPTSVAGGERALPGAPQVPGVSSERQISHSPPVPGTPTSQSPAPQTPIQPSHPQAVPGNPSYGVPTNEQQIASPGGVPQSVQPTQTPAVPQTPNLQPAPTLQSAPQPATTTPAAPQAVSTTPTNTPQQPPTASPPAWATGQRSGQVETVVAGQSSPQEIQSTRTSKGRQLRRTQQTQSAYMLVGIAMALIVFFFGAVLLLAIFLNQ